MGRKIGFIKEELSCKQFSDFSVNIKDKNNKMVILACSCLTLSSLLFQNGSFGDSLGMRYTFILMPILRPEWSLCAHVTVGLNFSLFALMIFLILLIDIDHIFICPSTTFETYFLELIQNQTTFLFNAISSLIASPPFLILCVRSILSYLHIMANFLSFQIQVNVYF